jgi:hypothetical protein
MTDFRAMCQELMDAIDSGIPTERIKQSPLAVRVDAALDQPEPTPTETTTEELLQLAREWNSGYESIEFEFIDDYARAVLARWGDA